MWTFTKENFSFSSQLSQNFRGPFAQIFHRSGFLGAPDASSPCLSAAMQENICRNSQNYIIASMQVKHYSQIQIYRTKIKKNCQTAPDEVYTEKPTDPFVRPLSPSYVSVCLVSFRNLEKFIYFVFGEMRMSFGYETRPVTTWHFNSNL